MPATPEDEATDAVPRAGEGRARRLAPARTRRDGVLQICVRSGLEGAGRLLLGVVTLALVVLATTLLAMRSGPVEVPMLARVLETAINDEQDDFDLSVGTAIVRLARRDGQPALGFRDVTVRAPNGDPLISAPYLGARFSMPDMLEGRIRVTDLYLRGPSAQVVRGVDGAWRFGLGAWGSGGGLTIAGAAIEGEEDATTEPRPPTVRTEAEAIVEAEGFDAIARILEGLAGDAAPIPELERLTSVTIRNASLAYRNASTRATWRTDSATLRLRRDATGLTGALGLNLSTVADDQPLSTIRVTARRARGVPGVEFDASARGVRPGRLGGGVPELDWLALIDAPIDATLSGRMADDGRVGTLSGRLEAGEGRIVGPGGVPVKGAEFDGLRLALDFDAVAERLAVREMSVDAPAGRARLSGLVDLERHSNGGLKGFVGQLAIAGVEVDRPDLFAEGVRFSEGEIGGRITLQPLAIDIAGGRLTEGDLVVALDGRMRQAGGIWESDLRAEVRNLDVAGLKRLWPVPFAANARTWVVENLQSGLVETMVAQTRIGAGEPQISLDFRFREVVSRYLGEMPPIREGRGRGHLRLHDFVLELDDGAVYPSEEERIDLSGSSILISDLWGDVTPADIRLKGRGGLGAILGLIDREPLALVSKLGLDPAAISGRAEVETALSFPLVNDLLLEEIGADARATLTDVAMAVPIGEGLSLSGEQVALEASTTEMSIAGDVVVDGIPASVDWREVYGETPSRREVVVTADATPALLGRFGVALPGFEEGSAGTVVRLSQTGVADMSFRVEADLARARLAVPEVGWTKESGKAASAVVVGRLDGSGDIDLSEVRFDAPGLDADGALRVTAAGTVERANFRRLRLGDKADLAVEVAGLGERGRALTIRGRFLDLAALRDIVETGDKASATAAGQEPEAAPDLAVDFDIEMVKLTERIVMEPARGSITRADGGPIRVDLAGAVNGSAPVRAFLDMPDTGNGRLRLLSDDAGAFLRATGLAEAARDGKMELDAQLIDGGLDRIEGTIMLDEITLREAKTFERILRQGNVEQTVVVESGGLSFREVRIPFTYEGSVITLGTSIATGPSLAVKLDGTIDESSGALDLSGVISPAYAVTGALNNIPLLGAILSGGKGEGILAMTFRVGGTIDDPSYTVNPLSILAPGFLRRIFTSKAKAPDDRFLEGLSRDD